MFAFQKSRTVKSMPGMLLTLLGLTIWLVALLLPMPRADPAARGSDALTALLAVQTICHAGDPHDVSTTC